MSGIPDKSYVEDLQRKLPFIFRHKVRARVVANAAGKYLEKSGPFRILDLGSADGSTLLEMRFLLPGGTYLGIEYSEELLRFVPELPPDTRIIRGDATNLEQTVKNGSYDIVSALALLEHLPDPFLPVREASGALRPGGIFVATCPNPWWDAVAKRLGMPHTEYHITVMRRDLMTDIVKKAGMELLCYERFMWSPVAFLPYLKIPVSPSVSLAFDRIIRGMKIFDKLFINQCIVARKPA